MGVSPTFVSLRRYGRRQCPPLDCYRAHGTRRRPWWVLLCSAARVLTCFLCPSADPQSTDPPTFRESQFDIILRRQRARPRDGGGLKHAVAASSRFLNLSSDFEFAGWGSFSRLKLTNEDHIVGEDRLQDIRRARMLGQYMGSALPGNAVLGSVFYSLPAVVAVCGV
jgi:hypothetical protein